MKLHYHHLPALPLHFSFMTVISKPLLVPFLLAHKLIDRDLRSPVSWYTAVLWCSSQTRWQESHCFFKAAFLDSRFPEAWFAFGHALACEGNHDQAMAAYSTTSHHLQGSAPISLGSPHPARRTSVCNTQLTCPALTSDYLARQAGTVPACWEALPTIWFVLLQSLELYLRNTARQCWSKQ
ncbi:hypothetical protein PCANC_09313 [Puccinia coronata f. sp. avenae]|uniref:Uncharacterized protein n=1 Tax=Puccinia coronata f. sp. avenae TaxID=200324 RepID=A0A2N5T5J1_9BASI|nr:hypothetical protein PCANC_09313 [Puccinia coronata f. sp. avenae]